MSSMFTARVSVKALATIAFVAAALLAAPVSARVLTVNYEDNSNFGFRDNRSAQPVPGNPATTLGGQRRAVMDAAIAIWASRLDSAMPLRISAKFEDLGCGDETTLGLGGPSWVAVLDTPRPGTLYPGTTAAAITGQGFSEVEADISVSFNSRLDGGNCVPGASGFWYGLDPDVIPLPGTFSFLELVLHEIGHGLGFLSLTEKETREFLEIGGQRYPDVMSDLIFDFAQNRSWREMTASQRRTSALAGFNLVFSGAQANERAAERLLPPGRVSTSIPAANQSHFHAFFHGSPPFLPTEGLSAPARLPDSQNPGQQVPTWDRNLACVPLTNPEEIAGNIALVFRGECTFSTKVRHVVNAGAVGIIIVDNQSPGSTNAIGRDQFMAFDTRPEIPVYSVSLQTGTTLRDNLGGGRIYTLGYNHGQAPRGTRNNLVNLYSDTEIPDSNVSHFSNRMVPRSLMNPSISNTANSGDMDFVPEFMYDIGWPDNRPKLSQYTGSYMNYDRDGEGCQFTTEAGQNVPLLTCYSYRDGEQFWLIGPGEFLGDRYEFSEMIITSGASYGSDFDGDDVQREVWGSITMRLRDCNSARIEFNPSPDQGLVPFATRMQKIVPFDCNQRASQQPDRRRSGNYMNFDRDGEGIQLTFEPAANRWVLTWYTYSEGAQIWAIGSALATGDQLDFDEMIITSGGQWGPDFNVNDIERSQFGPIQINFLDCNRLNMKIDPLLPGFESSERIMNRIIPREC